MTDHQSLVELEAANIEYYSQGDEAAFFGWLKSLPFVVHIEGRGRALYIKIIPSAVDEDGLRELIALFSRYEVDMTQLVVFDREEFAEWFRCADAYWHKHVFGSL